VAILRSIFSISANRASPALFGSTVFFAVPNGLRERGRAMVEKFGWDGRRVAG
jgi:hypothetical protein